MSDPMDDPMGEGAAPAKKSKIKEAAAALVEEKIDSILHVDRSATPAHPEWMKAPLHPELELTGPAEYDMKGLKSSFIKGQETGTFTGLEAYEQLKADNALANCLGIADGWAIRERGFKAYVKFFESKEGVVVALWKSVFKDDDGKLYVPLAMPILNKVAITKGDLSIAWTKYRPVVSFPAA